jgi:choline-sulfatase
MPHWPFCAPEHYYSMYYPDSLALPVDFEIPNPRLHPAIRHFQDALALGEVTEDMLRRTIAAYYGMITCTDARVGRILEELETQGFADNTCVIYTSDHGESLGDHGLFYKQCAYEGSVGVPLIIAGPDIPAGEMVDHPVSLIDLYPTLMDLASLPVEPDRPGLSWLPLIRGEGQRRPDSAFSEFHGNFFKHDWYMLVRNNLKYVHYEGERPSLFDLASDPDELTDLAENPEYGHVLNEFEQILRGICDPEEVALRAKRDLGLIGPDGEDYTQTRSIEGL